jgi:4-amino-4-deoxy-L-arabinose transferase-like glycosyltransferase
MLISGILTLPLVYFIGKRTAGKKFGLISMFLLAISPWHIMLSRWGLESNVLPFIFTAGYFLFLKATTDNKWFIPAMVCMALCLYAYGTAYVAIPLFLLCVLPILIWVKKTGIKKLIPGLVVLAILSAPIGLFLLVNARHWDSIHLGLITIPQLPVRPRYEAVSVVFKDNLLGNLLRKLEGLINLLWVQVDGNIYNAFDPYGYFYKYTLPLALLGAVLLIPFRKPEKTPERLLLLAWLAAGLILGILQPVNINRINLVFVPLILCVAYVLAWIADHSTWGACIAISIFLVGFGFFTSAYHGQQYRSAVGRNFFPGVLPAIDFASQQGGRDICLTDSINEPYIYVLFSQKLDPADYLNNIVYTNTHANAGPVRQLGRYSFGLDNCSQDAGTIYILSGETPPAGQISYSLHTFGGFTVYVPGQ